MRLSDDAEDDLLAGIAFYDLNGRNVGDYFRDAILLDVQSLSILGGIHAKRYGIHCMAAKRFPYAIYYMVEDSLVSVVAILDERRDPNWIRNRLRRG